MHPKEVILKFKKPINNVSTFVQGISESWDSSEEIPSKNIINSSIISNDDLSNDCSKTHVFHPVDPQQLMCRFLVIRIFVSSNENSLDTINIGFPVQQSRLQKLQHPIDRQTASPF